MPEFDRGFALWLIVGGPLVIPIAESFRKVELLRYSRQSVQRYNIRREVARNSPKRAERIVRTFQDAGVDDLQRVPFANAVFDARDGGVLGLNCGEGNGYACGNER